MIEQRKTDFRKTKTNYKYSSKGQNPIQNLCSRDAKTN